MNKKEYIEAAMVLAICPARRLPQVVKLLRKSGIEIDDEFVREAREADTEKRKRLREKRVEGRPDIEFGDFWDDFADTLHDVFEKGISISELSRTTGISRTSFYRYLSGKSSPSESDKKRILDGIEEITHGGGL